MQAGCENFLGKRLCILEAIFISLQTIIIEYQSALFMDDVIPIEKKTYIEDLVINAVLSALTDDCIDEIA